MQHDVIVVGAGPVGSTLALAIAGADLDVVILDARAEGEILRGDRSLALSHGTRLILERLDVWSALAALPGSATPITRIDISQEGGFGQMQLAAHEQGVPALGYVVSYRALQSALDAALRRSGIALRHNAAVSSVGGTPAYAVVEIEGGTSDPLLARLAVVADGTGAAVAGVRRHRHDYGQMAVVARIDCVAPHSGLAFERFTPDGPMALLPEGDHYGLVWTATHERADMLLALDDAGFLAELARHFGARTGRFAGVSARRKFPLVMEYARDAAGTRTIAVGNAAQTLHPVAGQGFNIGMRDAWELGQIIVDTPRERLGERRMIDHYLRSRRVDRMAGIAFTHGLVGVFGNDLPFVRWPRGLALTLLGAFPAAKRAFVRTMLFGLR
jgi:2-octaprenyl-6-methoxyphenol hydroxylase